MGSAALKDVQAVRLNYRYEPDVPPPEQKTNVSSEERNAAIQSDFDQNRQQELLDKTLPSPDGKRVLAVYHRANDLPAEFRLDMYSSDGKLLKKITADLMAVHFPDTIKWSPDSTQAAFVAMLRGASVEDAAVQSEPTNTSANTNSTADPNTNTNVDTNVETDAMPVEPTPAPPTGVLTFRTEQIYICDADGDNTKPLTQTEGLIYFYYVWSPDSSMLAALAATTREWMFLNQQAELKGEVFVPLGRPRLVEKNGRERRLDDALTSAQPVWSPDSAKVATAFDKQIRIYDAAGNPPTQAAIPLKNNLLLSSQAYDRELQKLETGADVNSNTAQPSTLPDEMSLVSYNPIVDLIWLSDDLLYFQTAYIKRMKKEADSRTSYPRWHRLIFTPQPVSGKQ